MPRKYQKKAPRRRQPMRRRKMPMYRRPRGHIRELASAQYSTQSFPMFANQVYAFRNFSLAAASVRLTDIGQSYQFFRIRKVNWQVRPAFDTFQASGTGSATTIPQLYWRVDREGNYTSATTLDTLKAAGSKPIRLDDKIITKSYAPAVVLPTLVTPANDSTSPPTAAVYGNGAKRISPWLPTNANAYVQGAATWVANSIDHLGIILCVDQDSGVSTNAPVAYLSFTVEFDFKKPLDITVQGDPTSVTEVKLETLVPGYVPPSEEAKLS